MPDHAYVVAAAVRIQSWIARTPELFLSRGASHALKALTSAETIDAALAAEPGLERASDAADIDGVVVLRVTSEPEPVRRAFTWLATRLSTSLPGVEWVLWGHAADSYVSAYQQVNVEERDPSEGRRHLPPADVDLPLAESCTGCRQESAVATVHLAQTDDRGRTDRRMGPDCLVRSAHSRLLTEDRAWTFDRLATHGGLGDGPASTIGRRDAANHLATIAADGNRVGDLFKKLAELPAVPYDLDGRRTTIQERVSKQIDAATANAVDAASRAGQPSARIRCAIDHLVGGDDVLVSVGARFAWPYVTALLTAFADQLARAMHRVLPHAQDAGAIDQAARVELEDLTSHVSLGVGMVFAQVKEPFAHCAEVAHLAQTAAKRAVSGSESAVAWVDLTVEAAAPPYRFVTLADLEGPDPAAFALGPAARTALAALLRNSPPGEGDEQRADRVRAWCRRTQRDLPPFTDDPPEPLGVEELRRLEVELDRARWWPSTAGGDR